MEDQVTEIRHLQDVAMGMIASLQTKQELAEVIHDLEQRQSRHISGYGVDGEPLTLDMLLAGFHEAMREQVDTEVIDD